MAEISQANSDQGARTVAFRCSRCHRLSFSPSGNCEHGVPETLVLEAEFGRLRAENEALKRSWNLDAEHRDLLLSLVERALPLVAHAVDIPNRELEAQQWLEEVRAELSGPIDEQDVSGA